jgi:tetratricopeptide (TPR) repeat protein
MVRRAPDEDPDPSDPSVRNEIRGAVTGPIIQAHTVAGDLHIYPAQRVALPRQLPVALHQLAGRADELTVLTELLEASSQQANTVVISAISGTAGIGKTALALHWAHQVASRFPDGQLYVNLQGFGQERPLDVAQVLTDLLQALGTAPDAIPASVAAKASLYRSLLATRQVLVVLDNARDANQVRPLLPGSNSCVAVVTSRDALGSLVTHENARRLLLDFLSAEGATNLLADRIGRHRVTAEPVAAGELIHLCARLPLALSIAAARLASQPAMPLGQLVNELADQRARLDVLDLGEADVSIRGAFTSSYNQLPGGVARMFRLLGLHDGPDISQEAAAALAGIPIHQARVALDQLVAACLLEEYRPKRFRMHDLLRIYSTEYARTGEVRRRRKIAVTRMADWYLRSLESAEAQISPDTLKPKLIPARRDVRPLNFTSFDEAIAWCDLERVNLAEVARCAAEYRLRSHAWQLAVLLRHYLGIRKHMTEWLDVSETGLLAARGVRHPHALNIALTNCADAYGTAGDLPRSITLHLEALERRRRIGDRHGQIDNLRGIGLSRIALGETGTAAADLEESRAIAHDIGYVNGEALAIFGLGELSLRAGQFEEAKNHFRQASEMQHEVGTTFDEANSLHGLGLVHQHLGDLPEAANQFHRARLAHRQAANRIGEAQSLLELGTVLTCMGDPAAARTAWQAALTTLGESQSPLARTINERLRCSADQSGEPGC